VATYAPGGILALDLSGTVGWAYGAPDDAAPHFGCWHLPYVGGEGGRYAAFENVLAETIASFAPARLVLEAAMSLPALAAASTFKVVCQQLTLRGIAYSEAYRASIPISEIDSYTVRYAMLGTGHFSKGTVKREVVSYCRNRGWKVPDHNAGDACLVWAWHSTQLRGGRPVAGRLFAERRALQ
jgi:Holliday junction resolvasome RuvABC endonuclease subunit